MHPTVAGKNCKSTKIYTAVAFFKCCNAVANGHCNWVVLPSCANVLIFINVALNCTKVKQANKFTKTKILINSKFN